MTELMAVDVLLEPDEAGRELALAFNARLRGVVPWGFAFDATHHPHVTLAQRYVRAGDLEHLCAELTELSATLDAEELTLWATGVSAGALGTPPPTKLVSVEFEPSRALLDVHAAAIRIAGAWARSGGDAGAFHAEPGEPPANAATVGYVERFVPEHSDAKYAPHMTVGVGAGAEAEQLRRELPRGFASRPSALALYQLGDLGAARRPLARRPLPLSS